jgi:hypothetical protein
MVIITQKSAKNNVCQRWQYHHSAFCQRWQAQLYPQKQPHLFTPKIGAESAFDLYVPMGMDLGVL